MWHLFDRLATGRMIAVDPSVSVRRPSHFLRQGKTSVPEPAGVRALNVPMIYSFARIGTALAWPSL